MKTANFSPLLLLAVAFSVAVTGCKKTPTSPTPIFSRSAPAPSGSNPSGLESNTGPTVPPGESSVATPVPGPAVNPEQQGALAPRVGLDNYDQDREVFKQDTVYFAFDRSNVRPDELPKVKSVADYLKGQPTFAVMVEGHCDERGTPEYNRALGERRALAIREALIGFGVSPDRIQTISYGEDRPADPGHDEAAWAKNRRGEFVLLKPKAGAMASGNQAGTP
jgi:peptidoglycan-associated lipoprotein